VYFGEEHQINKVFYAAIAPTSWQGVRVNLFRELLLSPQSFDAWRGDPRKGEQVVSF
jgi:hypothetical protein